MNAIRLIAETEDAVTISRSDLEKLIRAAEDAEDLAAIDRHLAHEARVGGYEIAKRNYLTMEEAERLIEGVSPVRVWREKRGLSQSALADTADVSPGYLSEIESGKKPGSVAALQALARALDVQVDDLLFSAAAE